MKKIALFTIPLLFTQAITPGLAAVATAGWRGDGSGKYPAADPPISWGRVSKAMRGLRHQASRPRDSDPGAPMADGVVREWLVLDPAPEGDKAEEEVLAGEATLSPAAGERIGRSAWKPARAGTAWLDFHRILEGPGRGIACAFTYLFSETGGKFLVNVTHLGGFRMVLNGVALPIRYGRYPIELARGWNRLLVKTAPRDSDWACALVFHARWPAEYESTNIAWIAPLPGITGGYYGGGTGCGSPVIVGDRIYLLSEPHDLICLRKEDGKLLWLRTSGFFDAIAEEDRKKPAYAEAAALAGKLERLNASLLDGGPWQQPIEEKIKLEKQLSKAMEKVDEDRYRCFETPDVGFSGFTPVTDGTSIYLWLGSGVTAAYDLEGHRRWIRADSLPAVEHGFSSSPVLVDGKIVVFMRDLLAIDASTGNLAWRIPLVSHQGANPGGFFHGTPLGIKIGGVPLIVLGNGSIVRARDGKILFTHPPMSSRSLLR
jgi:outer membrane protein assembly factor BamB